MKQTLFLTSALILLLSPALVLAQSPTSATIRDTVKQQVEQEINQIKSTLTKKAYVGSISAKADGTITITNHLNQPRTAVVTTTAAIKLAGGKDGTPADLKINDFVIAMGDADGAGQLTVKRLLVTPKPTAETRKVIYGVVSAVTSSTLTIKSADASVSARLQSATKYTGATKAADIKVDAKVVLITTGTSTLSATHIHLFP